LEIMVMACHPVQGLAGARMMTTWRFHRTKTFRKL
jgi:hypothetical protein